MKRQSRIVIILVLLALLVAIPASALASKQVWKARLTTESELHQVVGSSAVGSALFTTNLDGSISFTLFVRGLSGPATGAHIHGPADASQNGPVILSLCGNPAPAAVTECTTEDGTLSIEGAITSNLMAAWGLRARDLIEWMNTSMVYVNVHTALNPAGEVRGQIAPR
jgi:hypothetical protein